jgi:PAS domain S-box-containing protein
MTVSGKDKRGLVEEIRTLRTHLDRLEHRNAELMQAEQELRESLEQFKTIFDDSLVGLYRTTPDGRILIANPALVNMLGYSSFDELARRNLDNEGYEPQYPRSAFKERIERDGKVIGQESAWKRSDGTTVYVRESAQAVRDESGQTLYYEGTVEDITEYQQTKKALRESEEMFGALVRNLSEGVDIVDENLRCLFANPAGEEIFGVRPGGLVGRTLHEFVSDEGHALVEEQRSKRREGVAGSYDLEIIRPDGQKRQLIVTGTPRFSEDGKYVGALAIFFDITEKKQAEEALRKAHDELEMRVQERTAELQQANEALRQSENRYRTVIENAGEAIVVVQSDRLAFVNPRATEIMGYSGEELTSRPFIEFIHPDDRKKVMEIHTRRLNGQEVPPVYELRIVDKQGNTKWLENNGVLIEWNNTAATLNFLRDITERKRMEEELRIKDNAIASSITAIAIAESAGNMTYVNNAFLKMWGYDDLNEVLGKSAVEFWNIKENAVEIIERLRDGNSVMGELVGKRKDGSLFYAELSASAVADERGTPVYVMGSFTDITDRKKAQEALRQSENRYRTIIEHAGEGIAVTQDGISQLVNPQLVATTGYSEEEIVSRPFVEFVHPDDREKVMETYARRLQGQQVPPIYELRIIDKDERTRWLENNGVLIEWNGKPASLNFLRDITARKDAERELRKEKDKAQQYLGIARVVFLAIDADGKVILINRKGSELLGNDQEEIVGKNWFDNFVPERLRAETRKVFDELMAGRIEPVEYFENPVLTSSGQERLIAWHNTVIRDDAGNITGTLSSGEDVTERRQAEKTLKEATGLLETIFAHTHILVACLDPQFNFVRVNRAYAAADGREPSFFVGRNHFELYPDAENEVVFRKVVEIGVPYFAHAKPFEYAEHPERGVTYWDWSLVPIKQEDGVVCGLVLTLANVTEQKRAEQALRESEERFRKVFEEGPVGMVLTSRDMKFFRANPAFCKMLEYTIEEMSDKTFLDVTHPAHRDADRQNVEKMWRGETQHYKTEKRYLARNGDVRWGSLSTSLIRGQNGDPLYALAMVEDITDRKRSEEALRKSEERFRQFFENEPEYCYMVSPEGTILDVNAAALKALGYEKEELLGQPLRLIYAPESLPKATALFEKGTCGETIENEEFVIRAKNGTPRTVLLSTGFIRDSSGRILHLVSVQRDITDLKEAERALREREATLTGIFRAAPVGIGLERDRVLARVNDQVCSMLGYSREEMIGQRAVMFYPTEDDYERVRQENRPQILETGTATVETRWKHKDGRIIDVLLSTTVFDPADISKGVTFTALDITERKKAEEVLRESQERLRILFESAPDAIYVTDMEGRFVDGNRAAEEMVGFTKADLVGKSLTESRLLSAEDLSKAAENLRKVASGRPSGPTEYTVRRKSGSIVAVEVRTFPVRIGGRILSLGIARDVTARKRAEETLKASEKKFRSIFETAANLITAVNEQGIIVDCNDRVREFLGYEKEEILGRPMSRIIHADYLNKAQDALKEILARGFSYNEEYKMVRKDGSLIDVSINSSAIEDERGKYTRTLCIIDDITDRKRSQRRLLDDREQLKSLASQLSLTEERERHRLATLLHDHVGQSLVFSKIKLDQLRKSESSGELTKALNDVSRCLGQVIQETRTLTFDLSYPILYELGFEAAVAEWLTEEIQEKHGIETEFQDDGQAKPLDDDIRALLFRNVREVLLNIVKHARAHHVKVSVGKADRDISVSVEDDGVGFDPVEVTATAAKRAEFGLFSVRERLEQLGGHIELESKPGRGTKITMFAPLKYEQTKDGTQR